MNCEYCSKTIEEAHSTIIVLQKVAADGYSFFQCEQGTEFNSMRLQHWNCSPECMKASVSSCIQAHYSEEALHPIPLSGGTTTLHTIVLSAQLSCTICQAPLISQAYRFALTRATPYNELLNDHGDLAGWCCSLDHAKQAALAAI